MAALSHPAIIGVTAADQSNVKVGCRACGNHMKMPGQLTLIDLIQALSSTLSVRRSAWYRLD